MDRYLHNMRLQLVAEARPNFMHPDYDTVVRGIPLPSTNDTGEVESTPQKGSVRPGGHLDASTGEQRLNWGPEGEEGPLLASGKLLTAILPA